VARVSTFAGTLGYLDAQYEEFITNVPRPGARRRRGLPQDPEHAQMDAFRNARYSTPIGGGELSASTTVSYRSKTFQFERQAPSSISPVMPLGCQHRLDQRRRSLHGRPPRKNLTDKQYITSGYQFLLVDPVSGVPLRTAAGQVRPSLGVEGIATAFYGNPRQVFATLGIKF
jgi:iron complex outermembrane receptor protein